MSRQGSGVISINKGSVMQYYRVDTTGSSFELARGGRSIPEIVQQDDVLVKVKSVSLNFKDLALALGLLPFNNVNPERIPVSDGAGEVVQVGAGVTDLRAGDRVVASFFPNWTDGPPQISQCQALGSELEGMLQEYVVLPARSLVKIPASLNFDDAACFPCAGVTAWHALMEKDSVRPDDTILTMGTGGVSLFSLQIAKAVGARAISTTGNIEKEDMLLNIGADHVVNYHEHAAWENEVLRLTEGRGVNMVVEVGGPATLQKSLSATAFGGRISAVGVLSGVEGSFNPTDIIFKSVSVYGIFVGSKVMLERMLAFYAANGLKPIRDKEVFSLDDVRHAYRKLMEQKHIGKIIIRISE